MYGHPRPWSGLYKVHQGEYGDDLFAAAQLALMLCLLSFEPVRRLLRWRAYCCWDARGLCGTEGDIRRRRCCSRRGALHTALLLVYILCLLGGLMNRIRGGWLGDLGWITMPSGLGDVISRLSLSAATLVLITLLSGGNVFIGLAFFLWMWWAEMLGWGCYFGMAHYSDEHPAPSDSHGDCAGLDRQGMYDWFLGETVATWPHMRQLRRDWCGMWLRGLNWLAVPSLSMSVAGYGGSTVAVAGGLLPVVYHGDTWFKTDAWFTKNHFATGSPLGELMWGIFAWFAIISALLGNRQHLETAAAAVTIVQVDEAAPSLQTGLLNARATEVRKTLWPETFSEAPRRSPAQLLCAVLDRAVLALGAVHSALCVVLTFYVAAENGKWAALACVGAGLLVLLGAAVMKGWCSRLAKTCKDKFTL
jgi:hypothetical protein